MNSGRLGAKAAAVSATTLSTTPHELTSRQPYLFTRPLTSGPRQNKMPELIEPASAASPRVHEYFD